MTIVLNWQIRKPGAQRGNVACRFCSSLTSLRLSCLQQQGPEPHSSYTALLCGAELCSGSSSAYSTAEMSLHPFHLASETVTMAEYLQGGWLPVNRRAGGQWWTPEGASPAPLPTMLRGCLPLSQGLKGWHRWQRPEAEKTWHGSRGRGTLAHLCATLPTGHLQRPPTQAQPVCSDPPNKL